MLMALLEDVVAAGAPIMARVIAHHLAEDVIAFGDVAIFDAAAVFFFQTPCKSKLEILF